MTFLTAGASIRQRLIEGLYIDAMLLANEARSYLDVDAVAYRTTLHSAARVSFSSESIKVTSRLMHVIAWLLTQRAVDAGEIVARDALDLSRRLGLAPFTDPAVLTELPFDMRTFVNASSELHRRVKLLDEAQACEMKIKSPARSMLDRLAHIYSA